MMVVSIGERCKRSIADCQARERVRVAQEITEEETRSKAVRFRATYVPTRPVTWAGVTFLLMMFVAVGIGSILPRDVAGRWMGWLLLSGLVMPVVVWLWPRGRLVMEVTLGPEGLRGKDLKRRAFEVAAGDLEIVSAEPTFDLVSRSVDPWGRVTVRAKRARLTLPLGSTSGAEFYRAMLARYPHVLGLSVKQEVDVPALERVEEVTAWKARIVAGSRRELGRQIVLLTLYGGVMLAGAAALAAGPLWEQMRWGFRGTLVVFAATLVIGAWGFGWQAMQRWRFLGKIVRMVEGNG